MRRREFVGLIGGVAAWPLAAGAQQRQPIPVVGFLSQTPPRPDSEFVAAFREGLASAGLVEGRNVAIEYRWANSQAAQLQELAEDLVRLQVAVIVAIDSTPAIFAAKAATSTIPIVFATAADPVDLGLVASLNRPGGNITGMSMMSTELVGKRLDLLGQMAPQATTIAYLSDPGARLVEHETAQVLVAARALGRRPVILEARNGAEIDAAFGKLVEGKVGALAIAPHVLFGTFGRKLVALAALHKLPAMYTMPGFVRIGGLMSYSHAPLEMARQAGAIHVARILKGAKPAELPVMQPTKFEFVINATAARTLGIEVPPTLLAIADEVIE